MDGIDRLFSSLHVAQSALTAGRIQIDTIAQNIANAQTTRMPGTTQPYRRRLVSFAPIMERAENGQMLPAGVRVDSVSEDRVTPLERIHDPSHPHANAEGEVDFPNVNITQEMAQLMVAVRAYEASLSVQDSFVEMAQRSLRLME